ncbi:hypothetical protein NCY62_19100 (plasmid) [Acinetobacter pittii]|uniref:hypothetical protein n=1 Tax=Acinetobacter pittii TaxID=48296 RepID=UPI00202F8D42|nr:hypothetical protein [Acinetobacter pittii]MCM1964112.1 hypothetical protein [Acinetobacter pittii]MCM1980488.1 hypothetical protein [Acinetobacter pittii]
MEKGEKKLYVHAGIRITKSKNKVLVIFTLDDKGNIDKELHFEADAGDKNLLGLIFEGYFEDDTARLNRSITLQKGKFEDINYMKFDDQLFPCHKTVSKDAREPYDEAMEQIDDELDWIIDEDIDPIELENMRKQLEIKYNIPELLENVKFALMNSEKICAGWMILAKKEKIILNNFRIRLALMIGQLTLDQFKNEELIYENEAEALYAHSQI